MTELMVLTVGEFWFAVGVFASLAAGVAFLAGLKIGHRRGFRAGLDEPWDTSAEHDEEVRAFRARVDAWSEGAGPC